MTVSYNITRFNTEAVNLQNDAVIYFFYINSLKCQVKTKKDFPKVISESPL